MNQKPDPYGRNASRPLFIPLKGWWQVAQRVWIESGRDNLSVIAAGCAFYALFAVFPALTALVALYGLTADPSTVEQQFGMLKSVLPPQAFDIVIEQTRRVEQPRDEEPRPSEHVTWLVGGPRAVGRRDRSESSYGGSEGL